MKFLPSSWMEIVTSMSIIPKLLIQYEKHMGRDLSSRVKTRRVVNN